MDPNRSFTPEQARYIRFYQWACSQGEREIEQDFPLIRSVQSASLLAFLKIMDGLPREEQRRVLLGRIRFFDPAAAVMLGETLTSDERAFVADRLKYWNTFTGDFMTALRDRRGLAATKRHEFRSVVAEALTPLIGKETERNSRLTWTYHTPLVGSDCTVRTWIDLGSTYSIRLCYSQYVVAKNGSNIHFLGTLPSLLPEHMNLSSWFGFGQTGWDVPFRDDMLLAAQSLANLCDYYLRALPAILEP